MNKILKEICRDFYSPPPELEPWEWCEQNVERIPYSPVPGPFSAEYHPAIKPVLAAMCSPLTPYVVVCCAIQTIKSLSLELTACWSLVNDPGPTAVFQVQDPNAKDHQRMRMVPLMENTRGVRELLPKGADKDNLKNHSILFRNGTPMWFLGANNPRNRHSRTLRRVLMDECWQYKKEENVIAEIVGRVTAFGYLGKVVMASQGSEEGDQFDEAWKSTNQSEWAVKCLSPECGYRQPLRWDQVEFKPIKNDAGSYDFPKIAQTVTYKCARCGFHHADTAETRREWNKTGVFIPQNPEAGEGRAGFRLNSISSMSWAILVEMYLRAKVASWAGDYGPLKTFHQQRMAQMFGDGIGEDFEIEINGSGYKLEDGTEWEDEGAVSMRAGTLRIMAGPIAEMPRGYYRLRSICVDVQRDHFWGTVRQMSADGRSRLMWAGKLLSWEDVEAMQVRFEVHPNFVFVDCGDSPYAESGVYSWAAEHGWTCLRGDGRGSFPHKDIKTKQRIERYYSTVRKVTLNQGKLAKVFHWSNLNVKDLLARLIQDPEKFQVPDDIGKHSPDYLEQMNSERRGKSKNGKWVWTVIGKRPNHLWDCEAMQIVVQLMCKLIGAETASEPERPEDDVD